jgi:hypothetical protein
LGVLGLCAPWGSRPSGALQNGRLQLSSLHSGTWHPHSSVGEQSLSSCQAQWAALGFCTPPEAGPVVLLTEYRLQLSSPLWGIWHFCSFIEKLGTVRSAEPFCILGKQISWHPQNGRLPLRGGAFKNTAAKEAI